MPTTALSVKLDESERRRLAALARGKEQSVHQLMRKAIAEFIEREERLAAFIAEAQASWREYQDTGLHITLDELQAWSERLETDPAATMPACHG